MAKNTDDIVGGSRWNFKPPYRFVIGITSPRDEIIHVVDDPVFSFAIYTELKQQNKTVYLRDSFGKDALEFCKKETERPIEISPPEENAEAEEK